ncbi:ABC transporter ATP-binding protein [Megalodesulfovibrio paquesii]
MIADSGNGSNFTPGPPLAAMRGVSLTVQGGSGAVNVLRELSMDLGHGETVAVTGPSGSGKTTMLMVLAGLERPSAGQIVVDGEDLTRLDEDGLARFRRGRMGIVFQGFHLVPTMTALENAALPLELSGDPQATIKAAAALDAVGLGQRLRNYPAQLSGGEQQRVAIARAFTPRPKLLLADEPTGNLDAATGELVMELLFSLQREHGATLLLITHDMGLAHRCDRILRMRDGVLQTAAAAGVATT